MAHERASLVSSLLLRAVQRLEKVDIEALCTKIPKEKGMTYVEHVVETLRLSFKMARGSIYLAIHSFFPFLFQEHGKKHAEVFKPLKPS